MEFDQVTQTRKLTRIADRVRLVRKSFQEKQKDPLRKSWLKL